jgi:hypothetical protein
MGTAYIPDARALQKPMTPASSPLAAPRVAAPVETKPSQPAVSTVASAQPATPEQKPTIAPAVATPPLSTPASSPVEKPYVPAVEPIVQKGDPARQEEEEVDPEPQPQKVGFWGKVKDAMVKIAQSFENTSDDEV